MPLSKIDRAMLQLERSWWNMDGSKEQNIRATFQFSPSIYYARLGELLNTEEALAFDPLLVRRLRRQRDRRRAARVAANAGGPIS